MEEPKISARLIAENRSSPELGRERGFRHRGFFRRYSQVFYRSWAQRDWLAGFVLRHRRTNDTYICEIPPGKASTCNDSRSKNCLYSGRAFPSSGPLCAFLKEAPPGRHYTIVRAVIQQTRYSLYVYIKGGHMITQHRFQTAEG
jgi:hypothetical protein